MGIAAGTTVVVIAGAPGAGKSVVSAALRAELDCPLFEFGWIPEFRDTGDRVMSYVEEEAMAYENLLLVTRNYARHGFRWVVLTDLQAHHVDRVVGDLAPVETRVFTLRQADEDVVRTRVLDPSRSSAYRDVDVAVRRSRGLHERDPLPGELFVDVGTRSVEEVTGLILDALGAGSTERDRPHG